MIRLASVSAAELIHILVQRWILKMSRTLSTRVPVSRQCESSVELVRRLNRIPEPIVSHLQDSHEDVPF